MRITGVEAAIAHYREAGTKKNAHNRNCTQRGSAYLGVLLYYIKAPGLHAGVCRSMCDVCIFRAMYCM